METKTAIEICPTTTQGRVKAGALLVDVRERDEVAQLAYDVPNIVNIPLSEFEARYQELPKDGELVMVCRGGGRSLKATYYLMNMGYENVVNMQHGIARWVQKGFPTKGDASSVLAKNESSSCCSPSPAATSNSSGSCCDAPNSDGSPCC
ncbi:MAG: rhodanese-like domain-containing protein [Cytophagales bacterium]|nr:rhodanese-like domain-containing protein [Cytophagales bacterium]